MSNKLDKYERLIYYYGMKRISQNIFKGIETGLVSDMYKPVFALAYRIN